MEEEGVFLVFKPVNQANTTDSDLIVELVNLSSYPLNFTFSLEHENNYEIICKDELEPDTTAEICELKRMEIGEWHSVKIDLEFSGEGNYGELEPFSSVIKLKHSKFFKASSFKEYSFTDGKASVEVVADFNFDEEVSGEEMKQKVAEKEFTVSLKKDFRKKMHPGQTEEVDLHIEALLDDTNGMSAAEKLSYQLKIFRQKLDGCIADNRRRIIFIHGVGTGVLKLKIRKIMDEEYESVKYADASMMRYGMGATEVVIK